MNDLALLVADKNMDFALRGIFSRHASLGIRAFKYETKVHSGRDGGVRTTGPETLALQRKLFGHGIIMLDLEGSGSEKDSAVELEKELDSRLRPVWGDRAKAIVIEPELDAWMWGSENVMVEVLEWKKTPQIRPWLEGKGYEYHSNGKPRRPKEALEALIWELSIPRSSSLYEEVTSKISLRRCEDEAFNRLKTKLQSWFPAQD